MGLGDSLVGLEAVILDFEEEVPTAEDGFEVAGGAASPCRSSCHDVLGELAGEAAGEADEAFGVLGERNFF